MPFLLSEQGEKANAEDKRKPLGDSVTSYQGPHVLREAEEAHRLVRMVEVTEQSIPEERKRITVLAAASRPGQPVPGIRFLSVKRGYLCPQIPQLLNRH